MARTPLNLSLPLHAKVFQQRHELAKLRGACADLLDALQNNDLVNRSALQALYNDIRADAEAALATLREQESQLDPAYAMTHADIEKET